MFSRILTNCAMANSHYIRNITYTRGDKIGSGAFGEVYKAYGEKSYKLYALKNIKCSDEEELDSGVEEIRALGRLTHQNIVALYNVKASQDKPFQATLSLLLEYCGRGDLNQRLSKASSETVNLQWMRQITDAVEYLHSEQIIHRDLKPQNILLTSDDDVKIGDFGLATRFVRRNENQTWLDYYIDIGVGAACYVAPEMLIERYTYKVDVFSIGVIFYAIIERTFQVVEGERCYGVFVDDGTSKQQPFGIHMFNIKKNVEVTFKQTTPTAITTLVKKALNYDPKQRPSAHEIKMTLQRYQNNTCCLL